MIPFTSPMVMLSRIPFDIAPWQVWVSLAILYVSFVFMAWIAAKIYRVGIFMAWLGFEVWALVTQGLILQVISTICVWYKVKWRPSFIVSRNSFNEFFGFGSKMLASSLLDTIYSNIYSIVIGKVYRAADLAYYNRGSSLCQMTSSLPTGILQSVTYPTLCKLQHDNEALKRGYRRTLRIAAFVIFPMCIGVGAVAYPLINVLYTEIWIYTATLLSIMVFSMMWYPIHAINLNYLIVKGRSDLFLPDSKSSKKYRGYSNN